MDIKAIHEHCLSKPSAEETYPFGETPICYKFHGKIFAQLFHTWNPPLLTLKCRRNNSFIYRSIYPDHVVRAYHFSDRHQPYWFSVRLNGFPENVVLQMIDEAYDALRETIIKKKKDDTP